MYKFYGYTVAHEGLFQPTIFPNRAAAEQFCGANALAPDNIKTLYVFETTPEPKPPAEVLATEPAQETVKPAENP